MNHSNQIKKENKKNKLNNMNYLERFYLRHIYFKAKKRIDFYRMLNTLTANGISLQTALTQIKTKFEKIGEKNNPVNSIISDILKLMRSGMPFYHAIQRWIPSEEYSLIETAHQDIPRALSIVTQHTEHVLDIKSTLTSSLSYPATMFFLSIGAIVMLSFFIIPNMTKLVPVNKWPPLSYDLYVLSSIVSNHYLMLAIGFVGGFTFMCWSLAHLPPNPLRIFLDKLPPWNVYKSYAATSFLIAISSSIKLGASFNSAISQLEPISSPYLRHFLRKIKNKLVSGSGFGDAIDMGLFDSMTLVSLAVFAITNRLEQGIQYIADHNLHEQKQIILRRGKILGYCMMVFVTIIIGWIVFAMYGMQSAVSM